MGKNHLKNQIINYFVMTVFVVLLIKVKIIFDCFTYIVRQEVLQNNRSSRHIMEEALFPGYVDGDYLFELEPGDETIDYCSYEWQEINDPVMIATNTDAKEAINTIETTGITYDYNDLYDVSFLTQNCFNISASAVVYPEEINPETMLSMDTTIDLQSDDVKVLIYHTHGTEAFADSREGVVEDTVIGLGDELARILTEEYGINVYHDKTAYDYVEGSLNRERSYEYSSTGVDEILAQYPSIEMIIDVHRDGVKEDVRLVQQINGKNCAKLMFVNGVSRLTSTGDLAYLENPYKKENIAFGFALHLKGKELYGDLMRKNYISGYRYNLNKMPKAALVEVGAQTNTVEEARNSMEPLAAIIYRVISGT